MQKPALCNREGKVKAVASDEKELFTKLVGISQLPVKTQKHPELLLLASADVLLSLCNVTA